MTQGWNNPPVQSTHSPFGADAVDTGSERRLALPHAKSINQLFVLGILLASSPLVIGMIWNFVHVQNLLEQSESLVAQGLELGRESEKLDTQVAELERNARQFIVVGERNVLDLYRQRHGRLMDSLAWIDLIVDDEPTASLVDTMRRSAEEIMDYLVTPSPDDDILGERFEGLRSMSAELTGRATRKVRSQLETLRGETQDSRTVSFLVAGAAMVSMAILLVLSAILITRPIRKLDMHLRRLGHGKLDEPISISGPDDVSNLARRLDWLRRRVIEVDAGKDQFIREMSHQLKTPLASIREGTELLLDGSVGNAGDVQKEVIEILHQNSLELQRMLDNLLNFRAWRDNPNQLNREAFDFGSMLDNVVERYGIALMSKNINTAVHAADALHVSMDRNKIRVVVDNLVSNAVKYAPVGGRIRVLAQADNGEVVLDVIDNGPGIPASESERIFELFYRGIDAGSQLRGTGVGLALVRAYVEAHGGTIKVVSTNPGGHFRVRLPKS